MLAFHSAAPLPLFGAGHRCRCAHLSRRVAHVPRVPPVPRRPLRQPRWTSELVVVVGGTSGVGRLLIDRLLDDIDRDTTTTTTTTTSTAATPASAPVVEEGAGVKVSRVRVLVRDESRARAVLPVAGNEGVLSLATIGGDDDREAGLKEGLAGAAAIVISVGTTAYPTRAWRGGNTPRAVDDQFVGAVVRNASAPVKRIVLASSIGTRRAQQFPFSILNLFGVLDAKRAGEQHILDFCAEHPRTRYSIVRVGRLTGNPQTNIGMWQTPPDSQQQDINIRPGDCLKGDLSRTTAAQALLYATTYAAPADLDFCIIHAPGTHTATEDKWLHLLQQVEV